MKRASNTDPALPTLSPVLNILEPQDPYGIPQFSSKISAGFPSPATDYLEDGLDLYEYLGVRKASTFLFTVRGNSMIKAGIFDGDKVVSNRAITAQHDHIVVAVINNE